MNVDEYVAAPGRVSLIESKWEHASGLVLSKIMTGNWSRKIPRIVAETVSAETKNGSRRVSDPVSNPYLAGEVIGDRYKLVREIGRGGMGVVWVAHSLVLGVDVALKLIRASSAGSAIASRMAREAHAAARMGHPALVRVFDFGWTSRGDPYLVMELVQGETLFTMLEREKRINAIRAVQMLLPIADGLRLAHEKHIVHRDIKPDNILLATDAIGRIQPKLFDFGIAKVEPSAHDGKLTQVGAVLGSPEYMSPEQALGADDVDARTDVWALSVVLYELVTGTVPFSKSNYNALMQSIIHDDPEPIPEGAGDPLLWEIVARGLAKNRNERYADMTEFGEALALWLYERGIKEDLSGNSIRAVWLDRVLSLTHVEEQSSLPPSRQQRTPGIARAESVVTVPGARLSLRARKSRLLLAVALLAGVSIGGLIVAVSLGAGRKLANVPSNASASAPLPSTAMSPTLANSAAVAARNAPGLPKLDAGSASVTESAPSSEPSVQKRVTPKPPTVARPAPRTSKRNHDFGF